MMVMIILGVMKEIPVLINILSEYIQRTKK